MGTGWVWNGVVSLVGGSLVGFALGMGVGTFGAGGCWILLHDCCIY